MLAPDHIFSGWYLVSLLLHMVGVGMLMLIPPSPQSLQAPVPVMQVTVENPPDLPPEGSPTPAPPPAEANGTPTPDTEPDSEPADELLSPTPNPQKNTGVHTSVQPPPQDVTPPPNAALSNANSIAGGVIQTRVQPEPGNSAQVAPGTKLNVGIILPTLQRGGADTTSELQGPLEQKGEKEGASAGANSQHEEETGGVGAQHVTPSEQARLLTRAGHKKAPLELYEVFDTAPPPTPAPSAAAATAAANPPAPAEAAPPKNAEPPPLEQAAALAEKAPTTGPEQKGAETSTQAPTAPKPSTGDAEGSAAKGIGQKDAQQLAPSDRVEGTDSHAQAEKNTLTGADLEGKDAKTQKGDDQGEAQAHHAQVKAEEVSTSILPPSEDETALDDLPHATQQADAAQIGGEREQAGGNTAQEAVSQKTTDEAPIRVATLSGTETSDAGQGQTLRLGDPTVKGATTGKGLPERAEQAGQTPPTPLDEKRAEQETQESQPSPRIATVRRASRETPLTLQGSRLGDPRGKGSEKGENPDNTGKSGSPKPPPIDPLEPGTEGSDDRGQRLRELFGGGRRELPTLIGKATPKALEGYGTITSKSDPWWEHQNKVQMKLDHEFSKPDYGPNKTLGRRGRITYVFVQEENGRISALFIENGADLVELEALTRQVLKNVLPLPRLDPKYEKKRVVLKVTFEFK